MKKKMLKLWAAMICVSICISMILLQPGLVAEAQSRADHFYKDYTLGTNDAENMIAIALAQKDRTGSSLGYTEDWCAEFVSDCAILANVDDVIPFDS